MPDIDITINDDGTVVIEGIDFQGMGCEQALAEYIKAVGNAKQIDKKAEYFHKQQKIGQANKLGN